MKKPQISIIIPLYNKSKYIKQCIDSLLIQTFSDIEIICVDDKSTDDSAEIVKLLASKDDRIIMIQHIKNFGTMKSRSTGVKKATGFYIMFVDADDELEPNACEILNEYVKQFKADIYGFGTNVICPDIKIQEKTQLYFKPYEGYLYGNDILKRIIVNEEVSYAVWDKLYSSSLCKKVYEQIGECHIKREVNPITEDIYALLFIGYYADSFFGISDSIYRYHYGRGVMKRGQLSLEQFKKHCISALDADDFREFFLSEGKTEQFMDVVKSFQAKMFKQCTYEWINQIAYEDKDAALEILMQYWKHNDLVKEFALIVASSAKKSWETPFSLLPRGGSIILYGAGEMGKDYYRQITNSEICKIVLWVDREYKHHRNLGLHVSSPDDIVNVSYDNILIAVADCKNADNIKHLLINKLNISDNQIIWKNPLN